MLRQVILFLKNDIHQNYGFKFYSVPWGGAALDEKIKFIM